MKAEDPDLTYGHYTYADYLKWRLEEQVELIKGRIFKMSPAPIRIHQKISIDISSKIYNFLKDKPCEIYTAPFDVRLPVTSTNNQDITTVVQPDICVICDSRKLDKKGCIGAPDLIIEILSEGSSKKELQNKYEVYKESGVKEYWIIHPAEQTLLIYKLIKGTYKASKLFTRGDYITTPILPGFTLKLDEVFEEDV